MFANPRAVRCFVLVTVVGLLLVLFEAREKQRYSESPLQHPQIQKAVDQRPFSDMPRNANLERNASPPDPNTQAVRNAIKQEALLKDLRNDGFFVDTRTLAHLEFEEIFGEPHVQDQLRPVETPEEALASCTRLFAFQRQAQQTPIESFLTLSPSSDPLAWQSRMEMASMGFPEGNFSQDAARILLLKQLKGLEELQAASPSCGRNTEFGAKTRVPSRLRTEGLLSHAMQHQPMALAKSGRARNV